MKTQDYPPMTHEEKVELSHNILQLPGLNLGHVAELLQIFESTVTDPDEIEIDFESLKPLTLRVLESYIEWYRMESQQNTDANSLGETDEEQN